MVRGETAAAPSSTKKCIDSVNLIVDKSKARPEIEEFNSYIMKALKGRLDPKRALQVWNVQAIANHTEGNSWNNLQRAYRSF